MKKSYYSELEGMVEFYVELQINPSYELNTDGVIQATLFEFKRTKSSDGGVVDHKKQVKRYLKAYNSAAKKIPSISYLIYLNSSEFIKIDNETGLEISQGTWNSPTEFKESILNNNRFLKGYIDEFSIVAYNNLFCENFNNISKESVKDEFVNPQILNITPFNWDEQIIKEASGDGEIGYLHFNMNLLGSSLLQKQLGAFFTPSHYVEISTKYVRDAITRSKQLGYKDYLIIDRCAGTGNLERFLTPEELSHCILNTIDYTEWTTLKGLYDGRVRLITPLTSQNRNSFGLLTDGNALDENFINLILSHISKYNRDEVYIIFLENPPFRDETSTLTTKDKKSRKTKTHTDTLMLEDPKIKGAMKNELSIKFIWSAWNIYKPNEYILFSPIKYWKRYHLFDHEVYGGYITDKKDYNANYNAGLPVINWSSNKKNQDILLLENGEIHKIHNSIKTLLNKEKNNDFFANMFIMAGDIRPIGTSLDNGAQVINDTPCRINEQNILQQLPLWAAARYETKNLELNILEKSGDGGQKYLKDLNFLKNCFLWSCLTNKNKCVSNETKTNEMALLQNSICDGILKKMKKTDDDIKLIARWQKIIEFIQQTPEFNPEYKYGLNQIEQEINIKVWNGSLNKKQEKIWEFKHIELNDLIKYLKAELKVYYLTHIYPQIQKYELIK